MTNKIKIGLVGVGYWGKNLLRNFQSSAATELVAICESDSSKARTLATQHDKVQVYQTIESMIAATDIEAVAIATPVGSHYNLAKYALSQGKHVLLEKPITVTSAQADELVTIAESLGLTLMCDHTFCFSSPVRTIKDIVSQGMLGEVLLINSTRTNLGLFQQDVDVIWDLCPHDLSIFEFLLGENFVVDTIKTTTTNHPASEYAADAFVSLKMKNGIVANIHCSWISPTKKRQFVIVGTEQMLVWDDMANEKIKLYDKNVSRTGNTFEYKDRGIAVPVIDQTEPLAEMVSHFASCVIHNTTPISSGKIAANIVKILETAGEG